MTSPAPSRLLEAAYDLDATDSCWAAAMDATYREVLPQLGQSFSFLYETSGDVAARLTLPHGYCGEGVLEETFWGVLSLLTQEAAWPVFHELYKRSQCAMLSERLEAIGHEHMLARARAYGVHDVRAFASGLPNGQGFLFASFDPESWTGSPKTRARWDKITAHISAALRLRAQLGQGRWMGAVDWAWDPERDVEVTAQRLASSSQVRDELRAKASAFDQVRRDECGLNDDERLARWSALIKGTWSFVQLVEHDGKRLILAVENSPQARITLTWRQACVLRFLMQGRSLIYMSQELEVAYSTISYDVRALRELFMAPTDAALLELAATWIHCRGHDLDAMCAPAKLVVVRGPDVERLRSSQQVLVSQLRQGLSAAQIAAARGLRIKTIHNQIHKLYQSLGVHSRLEMLAVLSQRGFKR